MAMSTRRPKQREQRFAPYRTAARQSRAREGSRFPPLRAVRRPVRLLELQASYSRAGRAVDIYCTLESYDLDYCPPYRALSYTWGNPFPDDDDPSGVKDWSSPMRPIFLNGRYVLVRQNLYDALHELVRRRWTGFYWIDFMCINQHDLTERVSQVATMGDIFAGAIEVVCWLGRADAHLENVLELHYRFGISVQNIGFRVVAALAPTTFDQIFCEHVRGPSLFSDKFRPTEELCESYVVFERRQWFERLWVAQEVALAKRLVALCGDRLLSWPVLRDVAEHACRASKSVSWGAYFNSRKKTKLVPGHAIRELGRLRDDQYYGVPATDLLGMHRATSEEEKHALLLNTWENTRNLQASDPRDKIYGILGIVSRVQPNVPAPRISVDYTAPVAKLFTQVASVLIFGLPYLSILIGTPPLAPSHRQDLPSWVPDFNANGFWNHRVAKRGHLAGGERRGYSVREIKEGHLTLAGHMLDTISTIWHNTTSIDHTWHVADIMGLCSATERPQLQPDPIASYYNIISRCDSPTCQHPTEHEAALFRAHVISTIEECAKRRDHDQISMLKFMLEALRRTASSQCVPSTQEIETWSDPALLKKVDVVDLHRMQRLANDFRELVTFCGIASTKGNLLVGMNVQCEVGDQLWIIRDAQTPIILRPVPNSTNFTLVGEAHVDGVMFGEALKADDCPEPVRITIV
jgi:Heterokaryon incompatibility protein (HET)